ncbi:DNA polymerase I, thermostable [Lachnospiraceae bacterium]|nr:DNA polymerase I, thermostable [Lachnospiraceae bacterium]
MKTLHIDLETFSDVDITKAGLYRYVQSPAFEILLFAYSYDYEPVRIVDAAAGEQIPVQVITDLHDPNVKKVAHNAAFEINCLSRFYKTEIWQWHCTMIHAYYCGLPGQLGQLGKAAGLPEDKQKMAVGRQLIRYFCIPCSPTKNNYGRTRNYWYHDRKKWDLFKSYCIRDVETEMEIHKILEQHPFPETEHANWVLDQYINLTGVQMDGELIESALFISDQIREELSGKARSLTGLENPNSVAQLKQWVMDNSGLELESLDKQTVAEVLAGKEGKTLVKEVLKIRQELGKTSVKKYEAMRTCMCGDGRIRGLLQFYGASRTGRWAGRLVQVQNLPRNYISTLDTARELVKKRQTDAIRLIYGNVPDTLSQLIRTAFVPGRGNKFLVADFSAIEARVLSWLAGEQWRLDVFRTHGKIYEASASAMFGVDIGLIKKGNPEYGLRSKGKIAELALGYQGGKGSLISMGALRMGLSEEELPDIVKRWRGSNQRIVDFWYTVERYALETVQYGAANYMSCGITFGRDADYLIIRLPSGRNLYYYKPEVRLNDLGRDAIHFQGADQKTKKWGYISTYGGKLTENIVQAVARDLLAGAMMNLYQAGYRINFHIHDEVILEVPEGSEKNLDEAIALMCRLPEWARGLPLNAAGFESDYYMKD